MRTPNAEHATATAVRPANPLPLHFLQRTVGNRALSRTAVQPKTKVNTRGDIYEQQADRAAERMVRTLPAGEGPDRDSPTSDGSLDALTRNEMEASLGASFAGVKIHTGHAADALAESISARAFTHGQDVYFREHEYDPRSRRGKELLAHELTHTVQQSAPDAATPLVQRQYGATSKETDPKAIIPIKDLISYIRDVERTYPSDTYQEILTRIRVLYYRDLKFEFLLPDSPIHETKPGPHYDAPWTTAEKTHQIARTVTPAIGKTAYEHLTAHADENPTPEKKGDNPSPYVELENGELIDLGHVLLGLDALIHPRASVPYTTFEVPNIDVATHVADLGIAVVWMTYPEQAPIKLASPDLDAYYKMSAPEQDLLGDVDAFAVYQSIGKRNAALSPDEVHSQHLSDILESYYLGQKTNPYSIDRRWQSFMTRVGWKYTAGGANVTLDPSVRATLLSKVRYFSDMYAEGTLGSIRETATFWSAPTRTNWKHADAVVDKFLAFVTNRLQKEVAATKAASPGGSKGGK